MQQGTPEKKLLVRDAKRAALRRIEDAARTSEDFQHVITQWDHLDKNREARERNHEIGRPETEMLHWTEGKDGEIRNELSTVIPTPFGHVWWRQLLRGDFLDVIFDCPYEMHELTASRPISNALKALNENQIEVMYYWAIRQESPRRIAERRGQTDRNILKVYATLIEGIRRRLSIHEKSQKKNRH